MLDPRARTPIAPRKKARGRARNLGLDVASLPAVIVLLRSQGVMSDRAARRKLGLIAPNTAPTIIDEASRALGALRGGD